MTKLGKGEDGTVVLIHLHFLLCILISILPSTTNWFWRQSTYTFTTKLTLHYLTKSNIYILSTLKFKHQRHTWCMFVLWKYGFGIGFISIWLWRFDPSFLIILIADILCDAIFISSNNPSGISTCVTGSSMQQLKTLETSFIERV